MAATKSTTFNKMPHRNGTYMGNYASGTTSDVTPDLHLKMSKKIAQLTKVVYALNTKNDEHDMMVECLKEQHEREILQFLKETKGRVNELQQRIEHNEKQKESVQRLEALLVEEREKRKQTMEEFERFKMSAKEREDMLMAESEQKASTSVKQLLEAKSNFEKQLESFRKTREMMEKDKDNAMEDLVRRHHEELDQLMKAHRVRYDEVLKEKEKLQKEYEGKIKELSSSPEVFRAEREKLEQEYIGKLERVKTLYEKELSLAKDAVTKAELSVKNSQQKEIDLRNSWRNQEKQYKDRISVLRKELDSSKDQVINLEGKLSEVKNEATLRNEGNTKIMERLNEALSNVNDLTKELRLTKSEIGVTQKRCEGLTDELSKKTSAVHRLEATCMNQEQKINELKRQLESMREKSNKLETELKMMEDNKQTIEADSDQRLQSLKQNIKNLEIEKQDIKFKYMQELVFTKEESAKKEKTLKSLHEEQLSKLEKNHKQSIEELETKSEASLIKMKEELECIAKEEREKLLSEKDEVIKVKESGQAELKKLYEQSCCQVDKLSRLVQEGEVGLGSASTSISRLKDLINGKQSEIMSLEKDLTSSRNTVETLQKELETLRTSQEKEEKDGKIKLERSLEELRKELDKEWSERLKSECSSLRALLNTQHEDGQHAALAQLSMLKENEKDEIRQNSEKNIAILQSKIRELEKALKESSSRYTMSERTYRESANQERRRFEEERAKESFEWNEKLKNIEAKHNEEMASLKDSKEQELKEMEASLKTTHDKDMLDNLKASQLTIEVVKSQAEQEKQEALREEKVKFEKEKHILENELLRRRKEEIGKVKKEFETQLGVLKLQVQKTDELRSRETDNHARQVEELSNTIRQNQLQINELSQEISESKVHATQLQKEIETKGQEILSVRREANNHIRKSEERLAKVHQNELDSLTAEHLRETQNMVHEFSRAQELLKDKVSALQIMLEEAEARFRNRQSRDEDIEQIQSLKSALSERELELKKMLDEKRYYQLELLNRETNFNKVFKSTPNIGVINPLQYKKKSGKDQAGQRQGSAGMMLTSSRLDPMPVTNLTVHEKKLNNNSPLPPAPPKKLGETKRTTVY